MEAPCACSLVLSRDRRSRRARAVERAAEPVTCPGPPYIAASAIGETRVTPDRAIVQVTVDARAESPASAGSQNRDTQERVFAAVKVQGVAARQRRVPPLGQRDGASRTSPAR